jgi:hypothetical protein
MVVVVKTGRKILWDENSDTVYLPFGTEYALSIKNLSTKRALVTIEIDGNKVSDGGFVIEPNSTMDIERFVKNLDKGNKFKFIEKTKEISEYRGDKIEDGLIRVEYQFESSHNIYWDPQYQWNHLQFGNSIVRKDLTGAVNFCSVDIQNEQGITVPGSVSDQKFVTTAIGRLEDTKYVIVLKLKGMTKDNLPIYKPIEVKTKTTCLTCGTKSKIGYKFCSNCGTSLEII